MKMSLFQPFTVRYYEVDAGGRLAVEHLCNYMQQIAGQHAEKLGVGFGVLHDLGLTWVLARWQVAIDKLPEAGQEVVLETWPSSVERLQCRREFILRDATGEILARGGSWWVVVNLTTFRLERVPAEVMDVYAGRSGFAMEDFGLRLAQVKEAQAQASAAVRWSDIDVNQHVNNANYLDWVLQSVPGAGEKACLSSGLRRFEINFKSEARLGDVLEARCAAMPGLDKAFAHSVYNLADGREVVRAFTQWEWNLSHKQI